MHTGAKQFLAIVDQRPKRKGGKGRTLLLKHTALTAVEVDGRDGAVVWERGSYEFDPKGDELLLIWKDFDGVYHQRLLGAGEPRVGFGWPSFGSSAGGAI